MSRATLRFVAVFIVLSASTDGRAWTEAAPRVEYSHCPRDSHTEAYPRNPHRKRAYGCKSDQAGYLEGPGQGDGQRN
jgi:hypothetical protein